MTERVTWVEFLDRAKRRDMLLLVLPGPHEDAQKLITIDAHAFAAVIGDQIGPTLLLPARWITTSWKDSRYKTLTTMPADFGQKDKSPLVFVGAAPTLDALRACKRGTLTEGASE